MPTLDEKRTDAAAHSLFEATPPDPCRSPTRCPFFDICKTEEMACYEFARYASAHHPSIIKPFGTFDRTPYKLFFDFTFPGTKKFGHLRSQGTAIERARVYERNRSLEGV